jgi:hypothetical protein
MDAKDAEAKMQKLINEVRAGGTQVRRVDPELVPLVPKKDGQGSNQISFFSWITGGSASHSAPAPAGNPPPRQTR